MVQNSETISALGGINFVFEFIESFKIGSIMHNSLPSLKVQTNTIGAI